MFATFLAAEAVLGPAERDQLPAQWPRTSGIRPAYSWLGPTLSNGEPPALAACVPVNWLNQQTIADRGAMLRHMKTCLLVGIWILSIGLAAASHRNPVGEVRLALSETQQVELFNATAEFGRQHGFTVRSSDSLPRDGRQVRQMMLEHANGTMIVLQNFADAGHLVANFYEGSNEADWQAAKNAWDALHKTRTRP